MNNQNLERQAPKQLVTLDDLFAMAANWAEFCMRDKGRLTPACFVLPEDAGEPTPFIAYAGDFGDTKTKDDFVFLAQTLCAAYAAKACVTALEVWTTARARSLDEPREMPSEALDRREVIVLLGEPRDGQRTMRMLPIIRHGNGKFFNLGPDEIWPESGGVSGRFANLVPSRIAPPEIRELAKQYLATRGIAVASDSCKPKK